MNNWLYKITFFILLMCGIALSIKTIKEPDLWWQIRTGEWILENKQVPKTDVFSFTFYGKEWVNIKWGFEVLAASIANFFGAESVFLIQIFFIVLLLITLNKTLLYFLSEKVKVDSKETIVLLTLAIVLFGISYRINGRPEMTSHLLTAVYILLINKYQNSNKIYWIIPLQILWTNMHEAFGTGIIILLIFTLTAWLLYIIKKQQISKHLSIAAVLAIISTSVNPYGFKMLKKPFEIFSQLSSNKYTTELSDYTQYDFWQKEAYLAIAFIIIILLGIALNAFQKPKNKTIIDELNDIGIGNILLFTAFLILAATAYRNIVFVFISGAGLFSISLQILAQKVKSVKLKLPQIKTKVVYIFFIVLLLVWYISIVNNSFYNFFGNNVRYGLGIADEYNPEGAARFIKENNLQSATIFSDYLSSSYLLYRLKPDFKTFLDLRDLDVFSNDFFLANAEAYVDYNAFKKFDNEYNFKAVVLLNNNFSRLRSNLLTDSLYKLVFANKLTSVFIKQPVNIKFEFKPHLPVHASRFAKTLNKIFNPFYTEPSFDDDEFLESKAEYLIGIGESEKAKEIAEQLLKNNPNLEHANIILAQHYNTLINTDTANKIIHSERSEFYYKQALKTNPKNPEAYFGLGIVAFKNNNLLAAVKHFEKSCEVSNNFLNGHLYAAEAYKAIMNTNSNKKYADGFLKHLLAGNRLNPNNPNIEWNLGLAYYKTGNCKQAIKYMKKVLPFKGLTQEDVNTAQAIIINCGGK
ncbi:MAG: tetratricopeptide repeat protein [Bacteroidia bacterium]